MSLAAFDPSRSPFSPYGFTCRRWNAERTCRPDRHNEIELNLLESGSITYLIGGRRVRLEAGSLHVFWAAMPHQILEQEGVNSFLAVTIPLAWFLEWRVPGKLLRPLLHGEVLRSTESSYAQEDVMMFSRWIDSMENHARSLQAVILLEIQARLLRLALSVPAPADTVGRRGASANLSELSKAERLARFIAEHCTEQLSASDMGRAVELHPNYAMNVFKRTFGITLNNHLTHQRISHAQRLLVTTDSTITDIALSSGFSSMSRFNTVFRDICGCSPSHYRKASREPFVVGMVIDY